MYRYIKKKKNDVYKLLPLREEDGYWKEHMDTVLIEMCGSLELFPQLELVEICSKLEALKQIEEFMMYRKTIFEILTLLDKVEVKISE